MQTELTALLAIAEGSRTEGQIAEISELQTLIALLGSNPYVNVTYSVTGVSESYQVSVWGDPNTSWSFNYNAATGARWILTRQDVTSRAAAAAAMQTELTALLAIAAGSRFTCALISGGAVKCWGDNGGGQLGLGDKTDRHVPTRVGAASEWVSVFASSHATTILRPKPPVASGTELSRAQPNTPACT